jgi:hypothetical protein
MKNLFFIMTAILLINVSYAGEVGEDMGSDCGNQIQKSRFSGEQEVAEAPTQAPAVRSDAGSADR